MQSGASDVHGLSSKQSTVAVAGKHTLGVSGSESASVQRSPDVQALPSSAHGVSSATLVCVMPAAAVQSSSVHSLPSSTTTGVPAQVPLLHVSFSVHGSPSSQEPLSSGWQAPLAQVPHCPQSVQELPFEPQWASSAATQLPPLVTQAAPVQQVLPSAQCPPEQAVPVGCEPQTPVEHTWQVPQELPLVPRHAPDEQLSHCEQASHFPPSAPQ
jgi:hypothetical protein